MLDFVAHQKLNFVYFSGSCARSARTPSRQIGREIVQQLRGGDERVGYGKKILAGLSAKLQKRYGKGFSSQICVISDCSLRPTPSGCLKFVTKLVTNCSKRMLIGKNIIRLVMFWMI